MRNRNVTILFTLGSLAFSQIAQAVTPAPDGGYPGHNTAEGQNALFSRTTGLYNTALGAFTLYGDTTGTGNTAVGINVLRNNVTGVFNTAVGLNALYFNRGDPNHNHEASNNCAFGSYALSANTIGQDNSALGYRALTSNTMGASNSALGSYALSGNTTGIGNAAIGVLTLTNNSTGNDNVALGAQAGNFVNSANNVICIGAAVYGANVDNTTYIGNIGGTPQGTGIFLTADTTGPPGTAVKLGYQVSSRRYKEDIKPIDKASEALYTLQPVAFRYKGDVDPAHAQQYGFIAEDVAKVSPDLVVNDSQGKPSTLRFLSIQAMLLNEFLKEHTKVEQQQVTIGELKPTADRQQKEMEVVKAQLKEQTAQIQKVGAQLEARKFTKRVVLNNP
jgi:Chaperone of endosialidase